MNAIPICITLACITLSTLCNRSSAMRFVDVSRKAGLSRSRRQKKYGGAAVADLDADGYPDLLLGHHDDGFVELYFNNRDGTFRKNSWHTWADTHGLNPVRFSPWHRRMHFSLSPGGSFGKTLRSNLMYRVFSGRDVKEVTRKIGISHMRERGRSAIYLSLTPGNKPFVDVVFTNVGSWQRNTNNQKGFHGSAGPKFRATHLKGFSSNPNWYGCVTDVDNNNHMEIVSFHDLAIHRVIAPFVTRDITADVLPPNRPFFGTVAVAELDFDNDGWMDLYIARTNKGDLKWLGAGSYNDYLLRNEGGKYVDWTKRAGIPQNSQSRGVTAGDFNNDGYIDLLVTRWKLPDIFLMNQRGKRFTVRNAKFHRAKNVRGDMATAVDYNRDGKLDVILSEGHTHDASQGGFYKIMKNVAAGNNFLLVRVGNSPKMGATSLHATVRVSTHGLTMMRRVGSPGTAVSVSYIELVHFGLRHYSRAAKVSVRWTDGASRTKWNVRARSLITFGRV